MKTKKNCNSTMGLFSELIMKRNTGLHVKIWTQKLILSFWVLLFCSITATAASVDLSLKQTATLSTPQIGGLVSFRVVLINNGPETATNIVIDESLPSIYLTNIAGVPNKGNWLFSSVLGIGKWNISSLAAGDSAVLTINGTVQKSGLFYSYAEVASSPDVDIDSSPGNGLPSEDDFALSSTSTPISLVTNQTYRIEIPQLFQGNLGISWFRNGVKITATDTSATINSDSSLTVRRPGNYTFSTTAIPCQIGRFECASTLVNFASGPTVDLALRKTLLSVGPFYANSDIVYKIEIFNQSSNLATNVKVVDYIPNGLILDDVDWTQNGNIATYANPNFIIAANDTVPITIHFKIDPNFTGSSLLNTAEISGAKSENDLPVTDIDSDLDAISTNDRLGGDNIINQNAKTGGDEDDSDISLISVSSQGAVGNFVWIDSNKNGVQDVGELGLGGVFIDLQNTDGTIAYSTFTAADGTYSFINIRPGIYQLEVTIPPGYQLTSVRTGSDTLIDSDINPNTLSSLPFNLINGQTNNSKDIGFTEINNCPSITSAVSSVPNICSGDSLVLTAISSNNTALSWYASVTGGSALFTTNSGASRIVKPTASTIYYVDFSSISPGCIISRTAVSVTVSNKPNTPLVSTPNDLCSGSTLNLNTKITSGLSTNGGVFEWRTGNLITSALVPNPTALTTAGTYYVSEKSTNGCYSNPAVVVVNSRTCNKTIDISLQKTANKRNVALNDTITYTIEVTNSGPDTATNVRLKDVLPSGLTFVSSTNFIRNIDTLRYTIPRLLAGQTLIFTYKALTNKIGSLFNLIEVVAADQFDVDSSPNNAANVNEDDDDDEVINVTEANPTSDLFLRKLSSGNNFKKGENVTYTITVRNLGPSPAKNVEITDILPAKLTLISALGADVIVVNGKTIKGTFNNINVNDEVDLFIVAKIDSAGTIANRAEVSKSDSRDPNSTPNSGANEDDDDVNTITVTEDCNPTIPIISANNLAVCNTESVILTANNCNGTVLWSNNLTGATITVTPTQNTAYSARCQVGTCTSSNSNTLSVTVNAIAPPLLSTTSGTICVGTSATITATGCTGTVSWSNGATGNTTNITATAVEQIITATCRVLTCTSSVSNQIRIIGSATPAAPTISASKTSVCPNETLTLTASNCSGTVTWSNGQVGLNIQTQISTNTSYSATCTVNGCLSLASNLLPITVLNVNALTITSSKDAVCGNEPVTLTASACSGTITWSTGATTASITVSPTANTTYTATCSLGTCTSSANKAITIGGLGQTPTITSSKNGFCIGDSAVLTASACTGTITWTVTGNTTALGTGLTLKIKPTVNTSYTATCTSGTSCSGFANIAITTIAPPAAPILSSAINSICNGDSLSLSASNCTGTITWSTGATGASLKIKPTQNTTYTARCTVNGCQGIASNPLAISVSNITPVITSSADQICGTDSITLTASACTGGTVRWSTGALTNSIKVKPTAQTVYTLTCTANACVGTTTKTITVGAGQKPDATASIASICSGTPTTLSVTNCGSNPVWSNGNTSLSQSVSPTTNTSYIVTCGLGVCAKSDTINITVKTVQPITLTSTKNTLCVGDSASLTATGCTGTLAWTVTGITPSLGSGSTLKVKPLINTQYIATCTTDNLCSSTATISITVSPAPTAPVISSPINNVCSGDSVTLSASNCTGTITWSTGSTGASLKIKPTQTTTYTARCTVNGCQGPASNTLSITVSNTIPVITSTADQICGTDSITLTASACIGGTVRWSTGALTNSIKVKPTAQTVYTLTCTANACVGTATKTITVGAGQKPDATASIASICSGTPTTLSVTNCGSNPVWSNGNTSLSQSVSPTTNTSYIVTCGLGVCAKSDTVNITVNPSQTAKITATKASICLGDSSVLTATGCTGTFTWSNNQTGASIKVKPIANTKYKVSCGNNVCNKADSITINVSTGANQTPVITASATTVCVGDSVTLTAAGCTTFSWSTGATTATLKVKVNAETTYTVNCGTGDCLKSASQLIKINPTANLDVTASKISICIGESTSLTASNCPTGLTWSNNATGTAISVNPTSNTSYIATCAATSCKAIQRDTILISVNTTVIAAPTVVSLSNTCPLVTVNLRDAVTSSIGAGNVLTFRTGLAATSTAVPNPASIGVNGDYYAFVSNQAGCNSTGSLVKVTINACNTSPTDAEISVGINVDKTSVVIGDTVTYTIRVTNNGPATGTNIRISNTFPSNIRIIGNTPGLTLNNGKLVATIPTLVKGATIEYKYKAILTLAGIARNVIDKVSSDQGDGLILNNSSFVDLECSTCVSSCIASSLTADTLKQANGSYNIKFTALVTNCGNTTLDSVIINHEISEMFPSPNTFTVVSLPTVNSGSQLIPNTSFNGTTNLTLLQKIGSKLLQGRVDTVRYTINVNPTNKLIPYNTNVFVQGVGTSALGNPLRVSDLSNNGLVIDKPSSAPTVVKFYDGPAIGLAKSIQDTAKQVNGSYNVRYRFILKNNGKLNLTSVSLIDSLKDFKVSPTTFTVLNAVSVNTGSTLAPNPAFNGTTDLRLLLPTSTLVIGKADTIRMTLNVFTGGRAEIENQAIATGTARTAAGIDETASDLSNAGTNPDAPGNVPTFFRVKVPQKDTLSLGVALSAINKVKQEDGTFNVTYQAIIKNFGNVNLRNFQICDTLLNTFKSPVVAKIISDPKSSGGSFKVDTTFNGVTKYCLVLPDTTDLVPNQVDTLKWTLNVKMNGNTGPFRNNITVFASDKVFKPTFDISNDGINPNPIGSTPTIITFNENLTDTLIGLAKRVVSVKPVAGADKVYDADFEFVLKNYSNVTITKVQLQDNLAGFFGDKVDIDSVSIKADTGLVVNKDFTGKGDLFFMLNDTLSKLNPLETKKVNLFVRFNMINADTNKFENIGLLVGFVGNTSLSDPSADGVEPDADADGDPTNDSKPTPVLFDFQLGKFTPIGVSKSVDSVKAVNGTYDLKYTIIIKNYGKDTLDSLQLEEDLAGVFSNETEFKLIGKPILSDSSKLKLDTLFNGDTKKNLLLASQSSLVPGKSDTIVLKVNVKNNSGDSITYSNSVSAKAWVKDSLFTDNSQTGTDPDLNKDKNPGNDNKPTDITLPAFVEDTSDIDIFITNGISPDGNDKNDVFIVKDKNNNVVLKVEDEINVYIYNRWFALIYKSENYIKDVEAGKGWKANTNVGVKIENSPYVPDGTYYYVVNSKNKRLFNNKNVTGFVTVKR